MLAHLLTCPLINSFPCQLVIVFLLVYETSPINNNHKLFFIYCCLGKYFFSAYC